MYPSRSVSPRVVLLPLAVAAFAAGGPAHAATLVGDQGCYQENERVNVVGTGFTPNGSVNFSRDNQAVGALQADGSGTVRGFAFAPRISPALTRRFTLEGRDATNPAIAAAIFPFVTRFGVSVRPTGGNPARVRRIKARGFTDGRTLYAHVRRRGRGRNVRLGRLKKPCGTKSVRKRIFRRGTKPGVYRVQFDARRRYSRRAAPRVIYRVRVFRTFRNSLASGAAFGLQGERWTLSR